MNTDKEKKESSELIGLMILMLISKVYKTPKDAVPFMIEMGKYIDNSSYMSDKLWEFPGKDLESEAKLKSIFQVMFKRRI